VPQITYTTPHNTNPKVKTETNPPPSPPLPQPQAQEPLQQPDTFPTHDTILTVIGDSITNFETKRQRRDYYLQVNHVAVEGPITQTKWSHVPITFSSQDVNLPSFPHTDAMVITVHIGIWDVIKILIDNGSQAEILFQATFDNMDFSVKIGEHTSVIITSPTAHWSKPECSKVPNHIR
jgi:hypothetical protein